MLDMVVGQMGSVVGRSAGVLRIISGVWVGSVAEKEGSVPMAALGVPGTVGVSGVSPMVRVEMAGVVLDMVPASWLGAGVLSGMPVLITEVAVVSARLVKGSAEVAVGTGAVGGGSV